MDAAIDAVDHCKSRAVELVIVTTFDQPADDLRCT